MSNGRKAYQKKATQTTKNNVQRQADITPDALPSPRTVPENNEIKKFTIRNPYVLGAFAAIGNAKETRQILKYKYPGVYISLLQTHSIDSQIELFASRNAICSLLKSNASRIIGDMTTGNSFYRVHEQLPPVKGIRRIKDRVFGHSNDYSTNARLIDGTISHHIVSIDGIFFVEDWDNWEKYYGKSYGAFLLDRLEMINFELNVE